jgi:hypothetical protein
MVFDDAEQDEIIKSKIEFLPSASYTGAALGPLVDALLMTIASYVLLKINRI